MAHLLSKRDVLLRTHALCYCQSVHLTISVDSVLNCNNVTAMFHACDCRLFPHHLSLFKFTVGLHAHINQLRKTL